MVYPLLEQGGDRLLGEVVREYEYLWQESALAYLCDGVGAIHKHPRIVGEEQVALRVAADAKELFTRGGGDEKCIDVGEQTSNQCSQFGGVGVDNNFSHCEYLMPPSNL